MIYFETSYLAKCYLTDYGYERIRALAATEDRIACCEFGRVELATALHRKWREGVISKSVYALLLTQYAEDEKRQCWIWLAVTPGLLKSVSDIVAGLGKDVFVRAGDALHLACAAEHGFKEIYSNDRHLLAAAAKFGLKGRNIIA